MRNRKFICGRFEIDLASKPVVMGIVNVTIDSFSDGGLYIDVDNAIVHAKKLIAEGVDILDIGAESTRPGANKVSSEIEIARLLPVIESLKNLDIPISIDTYKPSVMKKVLDAGVDLINDVYAFRIPGAIEIVNNYNCGLCVVHMQGEPSYMQHDPKYNNLIEDINNFLNNIIKNLTKSGISKNRILQDPGFGFGKTLDDNYKIIKNLNYLNQEFPILAGLSRKSMISNIVGKETINRLSGSISAALACVLNGASIIRVHDVSATISALKIWEKIGKIG
ncbi:Dihydropteroate synthase [Candidatus Kinetoplastibacterium sorsogonicusi]|uniref:Dihydropteroate synthase n=1 Tax=Candidatus Kinetoplastidibacterium kentomonadis TaxID=1576550 RepID=A0A3S7J9E5_9PROT|nr:dihydropteroate synthase [Candidatus Kinetoplastibacterium sorsogonicusi]AWD32284.1 Dihydropteroate synthase [Candidatus Kinetoplastibacterium sorsogonicusi]